ncbi:hypothetical protein KIPB_009680 [Kipferlia bialata]|uniref:Uncharacterized protein n=1 Tax=Kipferlia bialata TaxID=797122 RepID=A0A9K3D462_9EUKA|nr:hypothetical protein KIPB_009680 [Kipferlia bialata]|eukprot:g9680.t1
MTDVADLQQTVRALTMRCEALESRVKGYEAKEREREREREEEARIQEEKEHREKEERRERERERRQREERDRQIEREAAQGQFPDTMTLPPSLAESLSRSGMQGPLVSNAATIRDMMSGVQRAMSHARHTDPRPSGSTQPLGRIKMPKVTLRSSALGSTREGERERERERDRYASDSETESEQSSDAAVGATIGKAIGSHALSSERERERDFSGDSIDGDTTLHYGDLGDLGKL